MIGTKGGINSVLERISWGFEYAVSDTVVIILNRRVYTKLKRMDGSW